MKIVGPKNTLIQMAMRRAGESALNWVRPIKGFNGSYLVISSTRKRLLFDTQPTICEPGANVISTSDHDKIVVMKPWRAKKHGKPYGSLWVALRDNNGKKKYFKLDALAAEVFGSRWQEVKQEIQSKASQAALGELF